MMSGSPGGVTRRGFPKGVGVGVGVLGLTGAGCLTATDGWLAPADASVESKEHVSYFCHQFHCLSSCCLKCTVRDGRIVKIEPNDALPEKDQRICLRGIAEVQHVYATDRLQTPLKRVGKRGEGKFVQITWDEAIKTIADAIKECQDKYGEQAFFYRKSTEASVAHGVEWLVQLLRAESGGNWGLDRGSANGLIPATGFYTFLPNRSIFEWKDAKTIILLGHNMLESAMTWSEAIFDAQEAGAKVIAIDPRFSATASKADQWISVIPGTDPALVLGMLSCIVDEKWYDEDFMRAYTSFPFLVEKESGKIYADQTRILEAKHIITGESVATPYVWDEMTQSVKHYDDDGISAALEGTWTIGGVEVCTEFTLLKQWLKDNSYTLEWASAITGVDQDVIRGLADDYANNAPAVLDFGLGGPDKYYNADVLGHAMVIITGLTGNIGKPGAGLGFYGGNDGGYPSAEFGAWQLPPEYHYGDTGVAMYEFPDKDCGIHCALTFGDAFTLEAANANKMLEWVKTLDFFAIADIYHSSVVDYADIVLPACTKFESREDIYHIRDAKGYVSLSTKSIDPLFEAKTDLEIERLLAAQWGLDDLMPQTYEEYARRLLDVESGSNIDGITVEALLENQGVMPIRGSDVLPDGGADHVYGTATTKMELYYDYLLDQGHEFPVYESAVESYVDNPLRKKYPMQFMQGKTRFRIHAYYSASSWFQEYYDPCVNISPADAAARGINTNDDVRVYNDRGEFVARALVNPSIMDGTLFMAETTYNHYYKNGFLQNVTNSARNERCYEMHHGPQILFNDTLVEIEKA